MTSNGQPVGTVYSDHLRQSSSYKTLDCFRLLSAAYCSSCRNVFVVILMIRQGDTCSCMMVGVG